MTNALQNFLASEKCLFGTDRFIPQKIFIAYFKTHCTENNLGVCKFNQDIYAGPFSSREIEVRNEAREYKGSMYANQPFIFGVDIGEN